MKIQKKIQKIKKSLQKQKHIKVYVGAVIVFILVSFVGLYKMNASKNEAVSIPEITPHTTPTTSPTPSQVYKKLVPSTAISTPIPTSPQSQSTSTPSNNTSTNTATSTPAPKSSFSISGYIYKDENNNGGRDDGEMVISGANIVFLSIGKSTSSDSTGRYSMGDLPPGTYNITVNSQNGMSSTGDNPTSVTITSGDASKDFGFN